MEATIANGASLSSRVGGTWLSTRSNIGVRSLRAPSNSMSAQPCRPEAYSIGKSSCSSVAPRAANRSNTSVWTSSARASCRSTLFTTTMGLMPRCNALPTTNLVCGSTPSAASTSTMAPSTMPRMRSTSPPKSAWPGVSTMLMRLSFHTTLVHLARIVMPRSFSKSFLSSARSATTWCSRKEPDWRSSWSTSVVLPWSTCAMMAMLRMSMRRTLGRARPHLGGREGRGTPACCSAHIGGAAQSCEA